MGPRWKLLVHSNDHLLEPTVTTDLLIFKLISGFIYWSVKNTLVLGARPAISAAATFPALFSLMKLMIKIL
ncbi:hypothetical protein Hdeb2414_s0006g00202471 [Helianthus debilis subsp. tardiflorus]